MPRMGKKKLDFTGRRYGILTVLEETSEYAAFKKPSRLWRCMCDCGNECLKAVACFSTMKSCGECITPKRRNALDALRGPRMMPGEPAFNAYHHQYERSAKKRSIAFDLSREQFRSLVTAACCTYCGSTTKRPVYSHKKREAFHVFGIDRVDNSKGYTVENSVPCCKVCNRAKDIMTRDEFLTWVKAVAAHSS